jgi:hypothetical protein
VALQHIPHFTSKSPLPLAGLGRVDKLFHKIFNTGFLIRNKEQENNYPSRTRSWYKI